MKISHNAKDSNGWLIEKPDKTITLINEQIDELINYIQTNYTPLIYNINGKDEDISLEELESSNLKQCGQPKRQAFKLVFFY